MSEELLIKKDMKIGDVSDKYPEAIEVLLSKDIHCVGCAAASWEDLEQGLTMHGKSEEEIAEIIDEMNKAISKKE